MAEKKKKKTSSTKSASKKKTSSTASKKSSTAKKKTGSKKSTAKKSTAKKKSTTSRKPSTKKATSSKVSKKKSSSSAARARAAARAGSSKKKPVTGAQKVAVSVTNNKSSSSSEEVVDLRGKIQSGNSSPEIPSQPVSEESSAAQPASRFVSKPGESGTDGSSGLPTLGDTKILGDSRKMDSAGSGDETPKKPASESRWLTKKTVVPKKARPFVAVLLILILGGILYVIWHLLFVTKVMDDIEYFGDNVNMGEISQAIERPLDGADVALGSEGERPVAIMIENLVTVRPQKGLGEAQVVFEALAEGGITRFLAVFVGDELEQIGPVRSARQYYLNWAEEFDSLYVHAGGSPYALDAIPSYNFTDLNGLSSDGKYFFRSQTESAPHNLYTSSQLLNLAIRDKEIGAYDAIYQGWQFKDADGPSSTVDDAEGTSRSRQLQAGGSAVVQGATAEDIVGGDADVDADTDATSDVERANVISIDFSSPAYAVEWTYDSETNEYLRANGGEVHSDAITGEQISANNVAVAFLETGLRDGQRLEMETIGSGEAMVFRDGEKIVARWEKQSEDSRLLFYDELDQEIEFNRGTSWIEIVPTDREVTTSL